MLRLVLMSELATEECILIGNGYIIITLGIHVPNVTIKCSQLSCQPSIMR